MKICYSDNEYRLSAAGLDRSASKDAIQRTHTLVTFYF